MPWDATACPNRGASAGSGASQALSLPGLLQDLESRGFQLDVFGTIREWNQHHLAQIHYQRVAIDWLKPLLPCMERVIDRAPSEQRSDANVRIDSAEGLILLKVLSMRPQDALDVRNLLAPNSGALDLELILRELQEALPALDARLQQFESMTAEHYGADERDSALNAPTSE